MSTDFTHDVAVIGGGAAGLSAAVALGRSLRSVVVIDAGEPRNAPSHAAHNVLGREGISPLELAAAGRREAEQYGTEFREGRAVAARRVDGGFEVEYDGGASVRVRRLLLATGLVDELPDIPGVREHWGSSVLHCPYCHGWEVRGRRIGVLGTSDHNIHQALLFRQLSDDVTLFLNTMPEPEDAAWEQLAALDINVVRGKVERLRSEDDALRAVLLEDGNEYQLDAVVVAPCFVAQADLYEQLGGNLAEMPLGRFIEAGPMGETKIPGVWAAGNVSNLGSMVASAAGAGVLAGAAVNADLVDEDTRAAVRARADAAVGTQG